MKGIRTQLDGSMQRSNCNKGEMAQDRAEWVNIIMIGQEISLVKAAG
jgi:hypothetical protein